MYWVKPAANWSFALIEFVITKSAMEDISVYTQDWRRFEGNTAKTDLTSSKTGENSTQGFNKYQNIQSETQVLDIE